MEKVAVCVSRIHGRGVFAARRIEAGEVVIEGCREVLSAACEPNARGARWHEVAVRVIEGGEEVTVDYGAEQASGRRLECRCGAATCRGWFTDNA